MDNTIGIIGGDLRIAYLSQMYAKEGKKVFTYLFDKYEFGLENVIKSNNFKELEGFETIITSIPITKDKINIYSPFSNYTIKITELFSNLKSKKIYTGAIQKETKKILEKEYDIQIIDLLENEELSILNAIPTAEGAIQIAMEKSDKTLHSSNVLVLGFGRIGKILSKMLNAIGSKVYCEARKYYDLAKIKSYGYNEIDLKNLKSYLQKFDFIFNTIPHMILDKEELKLVKKDCIIIDLSSSPGGVNFEFAKEIGLNASLELGLPGKVAPKTAAKYIKETIKIQ